MSKSDYKKRSRRRQRRWLLQHIPAVAAGVLILGAAGSGIYFAARHVTQDAPAYLVSGQNPEGTGTASPGLAQSGTANGTAQTGNGSGQETDSGSSGQSMDAREQEISNLLAEAGLLAAGYDYDGAIALLQNSTLSDEPKLTEAVSGYETQKASLVRIDPKEVTHVFFHSLIMDTAKAFDGDADSAGYNQVMTTKDEFLKILDSMYERGFVLVRLHDLAYEVTDENGQARFVEGDIMLPEGKKAFVMSQDDVCYYPYMDGDGFATRMVVGEDGKPVCEMKLDDGTVVTGAYDLVPILEEYIQEHPDFSYRGARAVIAFTGYEGILGYRTAPSKYADSPTFEQDKADASRVAQALRDNGWELASHSWGHRNMGAISYSDFKADTDKWESQVESLIGPTDIILFPFGSDIGSWKPYTDDNDRFRYLKSVGFRYFCNVDSSQYWVQIGEDHLRQGRRNLDGYRMYYDMIETDPSKLKLNDLFDVSEVFDPARPTPVPPMS